MMTNSKEFCQSLISFLKDYSWLHEFPITKVLMNETIEKLPKEWTSAVREAEDVEQFFKSNFENHPSLSVFFRLCEQYSIENDIFQSLFGLPSSLLSESSADEDGLLIRKHLSPKKHHEVAMLVRLLGKVSRKVGSLRCIDVGSGLGYLGCALHKNFGCKIIGIENDSDKIASAEKIQAEAIGHCPSGPTYISWHIEDDDSSMQKAEDIVQNLVDFSLDCVCERREKRELENPNNSAILLSLHSCADLSPMMIKMFTRFDSLSALVSLPCCYHKLKGSQSAPSPNPEDRRSFVNFPMSSTVKSLFAELDFSLSVCSLRLASEQSRLSWKDQPKDRMSDDVENVFFRALFQKVCEENCITFRKKKRHCTKKSKYKDFCGYVELALENYEFSSSGEMLECSSLRNRLHEAFCQEKHKLPILGLLKILQLSLQPVLEAVVLMDYIFYLRENCFKLAGLFSVFDKTISPRNISVVALRSSFLS